MEITTQSVCYRLELLIDTKSHKVLFAEANKGFVDFLFSLLTFPLGTLIGIVAKDSLLKDGMLSSRLGKLYGSVENLHKFMLPKVEANDLLKPQAVVAAAKIIFPSWIENNIIDIEEASKANKSYYVCHYHKTCVAHDPKAICPHCCEDMSLEVKCDTPSAINAEKTSGMEGFVGFVDGAFNFMIMDDLEVKPVSTNSVMAVFKNFNVKEVSDLEEKVVFVYKNQGLKLLKALLQTNSVLTEVFLNCEESNLEI